MFLDCIRVISTLCMVCNSMSLFGLTQTMPSIIQQGIVVLSSANPSLSHNLTVEFCIDVVHGKHLRFSLELPGALQTYHRCLDGRSSIW
jgi:hypothetical protein